MELSGNEQDAVAGGPLSGIRVLDLTTVVMGPYATQVLADLGADVIKVEPPEGDVMRHVGPMRNPAMGHIFLNANRNKRAIVLDLKEKRARAAALRLAERSDVLIHNVRPQSMSRLGLGYEDVSAVNPRIVYVAAVGFGARGRYAGKPAYDDLMQGATGLASAFGATLGEKPRYVPSTIADRTVGLYLANAVSAALVHRERTGQGQSVEVPMFEVFTQFVLGDHLSGLTFDPPIGEPYYARLVTAHRRPYATKDGHLCVLIYTDKQWKSFFRLIGRSDLASDPKFSTHASRAANIDAVYAFVAEVMRTRTTAEWIELLESGDIPVAPLNTVHDLLDDPHLKDVGFFKVVDHPSEGRLRVMDVPSQWSASAPAVRLPAPRLGEHTIEVLREAGLSDEEIGAIVKVSGRDNAPEKSKIES